MTSPAAQNALSPAASKAMADLEVFRSPTSFVGRWTNAGLPNEAVEFTTNGAVKVSKESAARDLDGLDAGVDAVMKAK